MELAAVLEKKYNLSETEPDDFTFIEPKASFSFSYAPFDFLSAFVNLSTSKQFVDDEENKKDDVEKFQINQAYFSVHNIIDKLTLKVGRQRINDKREWVYDEELDAARLTFSIYKFAIDFSVSENRSKNLLRDEEDDEITNYFFSGRHAIDKDNGLILYGLLQNDRKKKDEDLMFWGFHLSGEVFDCLDYWLEFAHVRGSIRDMDVHGFGFDAGGTYEFDAPLRPSITLAYAFGTGDGDENDDVDNNYRQSGLQDNNAKFNGVTRLKYYGEMFDPELSNMGIATAGVGMRPIKKISFDLVYHYYYQHIASADFRDAEVDADADGVHKELGHEIDLVAGYKSKKHINSSLVLGYFIPGEAFPPEADNAFFAEFKIQYDF